MNVPIKSGDLRDQAVTQRDVERQLEHGAEDRRQPDDEAVVDEIGRRTRSPRRPACAADRVGPNRSDSDTRWSRRRHHRLRRRQRLPVDFSVSRSIIDSAASASAGRPCTASQRGDSGSSARRNSARIAREGADRRTSPASRGPAPPRPRGAGRHKPDREHQLIEQHEAAAMPRARQFADIDGGDRHLAAEADALQSAERREASCSPRRTRRRGSSPRTWRSSRSSPAGGRSARRSSRTAMRRPVGP